MTSRWTPIARLQSQIRRPSEHTLRGRLRMRCVCGIERDVWLEDVESGRSTGCESRRCAARYHASLDIREMLAGWINRELELLKPHLSEEALELVRVERMRWTEEAIRDYLLARTAVFDLGPPPASRCFRARA
jgi:hypothetical protein